MQRIILLKHVKWRDKQKSMSSKIKTASSSHPANLNFIFSYVLLLKQGIKMRFEHPLVIEAETNNMEMFIKTAILFICWSEINIWTILIYIAVLSNLRCAAGHRILFKKSQGHTKKLRSEQCKHCRHKTHCLGFWCIMPALNAFWSLWNRF